MAAGVEYVVTEAALPVVQYRARHQQRVEPMELSPSTTLSVVDPLV